MGNAIDNTTSSRGNSEDLDSDSSQDRLFQYLEKHRDLYNKVILSVQRQGPGAAEVFRRAEKRLCGQDSPRRLAAVRSLAGCALVRIPRALNVLISCLDHWDPDIKYEALIALAILHIREAAGWLTRNRNKNALASNRFCNTSEASSFVKGLYKQGAIAVFVDQPIWNEKWRITDEGGPYAAALLVFLPRHSRNRKTLLKIYDREVRREGFEPEENCKQNYIRFWWD